MKGQGLLVATIMVAVSLAGCFGGDDGAASFDFEPGTKGQETGKVVGLRMWVEDIVQKELYPGMNANLWAFCAEPVDPEDTYSANAIEYWDEGKKCSVPGPTLRVTQGDRVIVQFENDHFHAHTIHWHGQHVPFESDGVPGVTQDSVPGQGGSFTYDFVAKRAGTLWYHCHVDVQFHVMMGLYGMMIVEPQDTTYEPKDIDDEFHIILSGTRREHVEHIPPLPGEVVDPHAEHKHGGACGASGQQGCQNPAVVTRPDIYLMNGVSFPNTLNNEKTHLYLEPGERVRIRLVNAGETTETWHWHGHDVLVTHKDGNPLPPAARYWVETLEISSGERYDVVIEGSEAQAGNWVMHTHVEDHVANDKQAPGGMLTMISYPEFADELSPFAAELPGGKPFTRPREVPEDYRYEWGRAWSAAESVSATLDDLPAQDLCLVEDVYLGYHLYGDTLSLQASELTITVRDGAGERVHEETLGGDGGIVAGSYSPAAADLKAGNYTVKVSGQAVGVQLHATGIVDYFPTEQAAKDAGRDCAPVKSGDGHAHEH